MPGMPSALPEDVKEHWEQATKPKEKAAIINAVIPKDVQYNDIFHGLLRP